MYVIWFSTVWSRVSFQPEVPKQLWLDSKQRKKLYKEGEQDNHTTKSSGDQETEGGYVGKQKEASRIWQMQPLNRQISW